MNIGLAWYLVYSTGWQPINSGMVHCISSVSHWCRRFRLDLLWGNLGDAMKIGASLQMII